MKIAFIGQKGIVEITGGVERRVSEVSTRMAQDGHDVFVYARFNIKEIFSKKNRIKKYKGVNIIYLPTIPLKSLDAILHTFIASIHILFQNYDVVHYQAPGPSSLCWIVKIFRPDIALVATFNSQDEKHKKWGIIARTYLRFGEFVISNVPDKTIVVSKILKKLVRDEYNKEAMVIHNGAYVVRSNEIDFISEIGLERHKYFLTFSRLVRHKGIHYLINAFKDAKIKEDIPGDFKLVIVGGGSYTDDYIMEVKKMAKGRNDIMFLGNQSEAKQHAQLFSNAFAYVQPSEAEGLSNSLLEALGHGLVVIASDIPENLLPIGENGLIFRSGDESDLREKMVFAINNKDSLLKMRNSAQENIEKNYNWQVNADRTLSLYEEIIKQKSNC